jgi:hypothetical protein
MRHGADDDVTTAEAEPEPEPEGDQLPAELDVTGLVGPYQFPNIKRRRTAGTLHLIVAALCAGGWALSDNRGLWMVAVLLGVIGLYHWFTAWDVKLDETDALVIATRTVGFPVGHASAGMAWRGWRSRPEWRILLYSADEPPTTRGLVQVDARSGHVNGTMTQANPEDWSQFS